MWEITYRKWFTRFKDSDFHLNDFPRSKRLKELTSTELENLLRKNCKLSVYELVKYLNVYPITVDHLLYKLENVNKVGKLVPHKLTDMKMYQWLTACIFLSSRI